MEIRNRAVDSREVLVFFLTLAAGVVISGCYGMVHNQISYTIAPEYFTKFKFSQFGLEKLALPDRTRAALVGFMASWWMGIPIGVLVGAPGFFHADHRRMLRTSLASFGVVLVVAALTGLAGLLFGYLRTRRIDPMLYNDWYVPNRIFHLRRFLCAGYMHNASYLGGALGILAAWLYQYGAGNYPPRGG